MQEPKTMKIIVASYKDNEGVNEYLSILTTKDKTIAHLNDFTIRQEFDWKYGQEMADDLIADVEEILQMHRIRMSTYHSLIAYKPQDETFINQALMDKVQSIVKFLEFG